MCHSFNPLFMLRLENGTIPPPPPLLLLTQLENARPSDVRRRMDLSAASDGVEWSNRVSMKLKYNNRIADGMRSDS